MELNPIPIFRIFDYRKAIEFYVNWLGFKVDWEHKFNDFSPIYFQVSLYDFKLHLTEHHGDCTPGSKVFVEITNNLEQFHQQLIDKNYKFNKPGLDNKLLFSQSL